MDDNKLNINKAAKEFYSYLNNYITKKVNDPHIAEDLTQEVMYHLSEAEEKNHEIRNVKAWLFQTTRHVIADYYREEKRNPIAKAQDKFPTEFSDHKTPKKVAEADFLVPMIKLLPEKYSKPLLMSDIEDLPQNVIAEKLNIGLSATKMRIHRARKKLYDLFRTCCYIEFNSNGDFAGCTVKDHCEPLLELKKELCNGKKY